MTKYNVGDKIMCSQGICNIVYNDNTDIPYLVRDKDGYDHWLSDMNIQGKIIGNKLVRNNNNYYYDVNSLINVLGQTMSTSYATISTAFTPTFFEPISISSDDWDF